MFKGRCEPRQLECTFLRQKCTLRNSRLNPVWQCFARISDIFGRNTQNVRLIPTQQWFAGNFHLRSKVAKSTVYLPIWPKHAIRLHAWIFQKSIPLIIPCFKSNHRGDPYHRFEMHVLHLSAANHCVVILSWRGSGEIADLAKNQSCAENALQPREIRDVTPINTNRISMKNERKFSLDVAEPAGGRKTRQTRSLQIFTSARSARSKNLGFRGVAEKPGRTSIYKFLRAHEVREVKIWRSTLWIRLLILYKNFNRFRLTPKPDKFSLRSLRSLVKIYKTPGILIGNLTIS